MQARVDLVTIFPFLMTMVKMLMPGHQVLPLMGYIFEASYSTYDKIIASISYSRTVSKKIATIEKILLHLYM